MTKEVMIELAKQSGWEYAHGESGFEPLWAFAKLVAEHERKACAKLCDAFQARDVGMQPAECAGAIRARGQE